MRFAHDTLAVQCIFPKRSNAVTDRIGRPRTEHFGLSGEERDFIGNYDIKDRMGQGGNDGEDR